MRNLEKLKEDYEKMVIQKKRTGSHNWGNFDLTDYNALIALAKEGNELNMYKLISTALEAGFMAGYNARKREEKGADKMTLIESRGENTMGEKINAYISENGLKFDAIADRAGIQMNTFSAMMNGKRKITAEDYFAICKALDVPLEQFAA